MSRKRLDKYSRPAAKDATGGDKRLNKKERVQEHDENLGHDSIPGFLTEKCSEFRISLDDLASHLGISPEKKDDFYCLFNEDNAYLKGRLLIPNEALEQAVTNLFSLNANDFKHWRYLIIAQRKINNPEFEYEPPERGIASLVRPSIEMPPQETHNRLVEHYEKLFAAQKEFYDFLSGRLEKPMTPQALSEMLDLHIDVCEGRRLPWLQQDKVTYSSELAEKISESDWREHFVAFLSYAFPAASRSEGEISAKMLEREPTLINIEGFGGNSVDIDLEFRSMLAELRTTYRQKHTVSEAKVAAFIDETYGGMRRPKSGPPAIYLTPPGLEEYVQFIQKPGGRLHYPYATSDMVSANMLRHNPKLISIKVGIKTGSINKDFRATLAKLEKQYQEKNRVTEAEAVAYVNETYGGMRKPKDGGNVPTIYLTPKGLEEYVKFIQQPGQRLGYPALGENEISLRGRKLGDVPISVNAKYLARRLKLGNTAEDLVEEFLRQLGDDVQKTSPQNENNFNWIASDLLYSLRKTKTSLASPSLHADALGMLLDQYPNLLPREWKKIREKNKNRPGDLPAEEWIADYHGVDKNTGQDIWHHDGKKILQLIEKASSNKHVR